MREITLLVSGEDVEAVTGVLNDENIDYVAASEEENGSDAMVIEFPIPTEAVDHVLSRVRETGFDDGDYSVVSTIETAQTTNIDELEKRFVSGSETDDSVAHEEIRSKAIGMTPGAGTYYAMTLLSAFVATAGLLLDSPAIVVGSMVIAPQVSAAMTGTVGTVINDREMVVDGLSSLLGGLVVAVCGSLAFAVLVRHGGFFPSTIDVSAIQQVNSRISPGLLSTVVGVSAGAAGAFGLATALPVSLVGVMIAAALIPAAAAVGIGVAWGEPLIALGALVLLLTNVVAIVLAGLVVFWHLGYRPDGWNAGHLRANLRRDRIGTMLTAVLVLSVVLLAGGAVLGQHVAFENEVHDEVRTVLADERYEDLEVVGVRVEFEDRGLLSETNEIAVSVSRPADRAYPDLAEAIDERVSERTGRDVAVTVEYVEQTTTESGNR
ncbi:TIGR00341 family protein [Saliphagus infecundisoli]|uniref:TIGR00341 family protein n=1 Tax=Saliphagus infecundisoli TaxID=1849069 RepID=A0ABD5QGQ6_9EURY|nr:TIGR00341 family protein [Saliphagus infecundisoli]